MLEGAYVCVPVHSYKIYVDALCYIYLCSMGVTKAGYTLFLVTASRDC